MVDSTAPTPPSIHARAISPIGVSLWWDGAYDAVGVTSYTLYRDDVAVKTGITTTNYIDGALTASTEYKFQVTALDAASNESNKSNIRRVTTQAASVQAAATATVASPEPTNPGRVEIDFGTGTPVHHGVFTITESRVNPRSRVLASIAYEAPTNRSLDEAQEMMYCVAKANAGSFTLFVHSHNHAMLGGKYKVNYTVDNS